VSRACPGRETALLDRAAGLLDDGATALLARHLQACPGCRAEAEAIERALGLVRLAPPTPAERDAVAAAGRGALHMIRAGRRDRRRAWGLGLGVAAAAVVLALLAPAVLRERPAGRPASPAIAGGAAAVPAAYSWELPDLDAAWEASAVAVPGGDVDLPAEMLFAELQDVDLDPE
jgi:anti-sigma factor RsiW